MYQHHGQQYTSNKQHNNHFCLSVVLMSQIESFTQHTVIKAQYFIYTRARIPSITHRYLTLSPCWQGMKIIVICRRAKFLNVMQGLYYSVHANIFSCSYGCSHSIFCPILCFFRAGLVARSVRQTSQTAFQNKFKPNPTVNKKVQKTGEYTKYAYTKPIYILVTFQHHCCHHKMYYNVHGA